MNYKLIQKGYSGSVDRSLEELLKEVQNTSLILIRGVPGSGKSTLAKQLQEGNSSTSPFKSIKHYESDQFFIEDGVYKFDGKKIKAAHNDCKMRTAFDVCKGEDQVIVSNTFIQYWEIKPYLDMAKKLGVSVQVIECNGGFKDIHNVPTGVVERMKERWQEVRV